MNKPNVIISGNGTLLNNGTFTAYGESGVQINGICFENNGRMIIGPTQAYNMIVRNRGKFSMKSLKQGTKENKPIATIGILANITTIITPIVNFISNLIK